MLPSTFVRLIWAGYERLGGSPCLQPARACYWQGIQSFTLAHMSWSTVEERVSVLDVKKVCTLNYTAPAIWNISPYVTVIWWKGLSLVGSVSHNTPGLMSSIQKKDGVRLVILFLFVTGLLFLYLFWTRLTFTVKLNNYLRPCLDESCEIGFCQSWYANCV